MLWCFAVVGTMGVASLMIGIAFGVDDKEQNIGDVLIASSIVPYDFKKVTSEKSTVRAQSVSTSTLLINK